MQSIWAIAALLVLSGIAVGQTDPAREEAARAPRFDVASIKPAAPGARMPTSRATPGGGIFLTDVTVESLMVNAWHLLPYQIVGRPEWIGAARYDISAKSEKPVQPGEVGLMLRALLADRFGLVVHRETRDLPIYALVIARKDGRLGPSLIESKDGGCTPHNPSNPPPLPEPGKPSTRWCGLLMMFPRRLTGAAVALVALAEQLSVRAGRPVIDMTGLKATYDINLVWTSDEGQLPIFEPLPDSGPPSELGTQTIFAALTEQLGLTLESRRGPVEVLVIDHVERPSEN